MQFGAILLYTLLLKRKIDNQEIFLHIVPALFITKAVKFINHDPEVIHPSNFFKTAIKPLWFK